MISTAQSYVSKKITHYLPEFVYGSIDGTVTTFAIIAGIAGANLSAATVVILGFSNVLADGFSMASSNYLSEQSHQDQNPDSDHQSPIKTALATFIFKLKAGIKSSVDLPFKLPDKLAVPFAFKSAKLFL